MSNKTRDNVEAAASGETDPTALSAAAKTEPKTAPPQDNDHVAEGAEKFPVKKGDGKAPYREDFANVYARLAALEAAVASIVDALAAVSSNSDATAAAQKVAALQNDIAILRGE